MTPTEFLSQVWPGAGIYCLAVPAVKGWNHKRFSKIEDAAAWADANKHQHDIYFAMHTLKAEKVWNPNKTNSKGEKGKWEIRSHANMLETQCFFMEVDVGGEVTKYPDQVTAIAALKQFCHAVKLPAPTITSSGRGIHVFWPLDSAISSEQWRPYAFKLHQLVRHQGLLIDHTKITDQSAVLRVPGTFHMKDPTQPKPVTILRSGKVTAQADFLKMIDDAVIRAGLTPRTEPVFKGTAIENMLGSNLEKDYGPPPTMRALLKACAQMRFIAEAKGNVSEPIWYFGMIGVMQFVKDGREWVHRFSSGYSSYSRDETDAKIDQWNKGVASCQTIADKNGDSLCDGCPFAKDHRNPVWAARRMDVAAAPVAAYTVGTQTIQVQVIDPPAPYKRLADGRIGFVAKDKEGEERHEILLDYDFYPVRRLTNEADRKEYQLWRAVLPRTGEKDVLIEADALYDQRKLMSALANEGVYVDQSQKGAMEKYMTAYIKRLQAEMDAEAQASHLGWTEDGMSFILPDRILQPDGSVKPSSLAPRAAQFCTEIKTAGTLQRQIELMSFYNAREYLPNQAYILGALAAPLMRFTGQHGVVVTASGDPGASKSTSLYTASSFWGDPIAYPVNGTQTGASTLAREARARVFSNLPLCVDEITNMKLDQAQALAMGGTQPGEPDKLGRNGQLRNSRTNAIKANIVLATNNNSLHALLSTSNTAGTAGSMRVFEIKFKVCSIHTKPEADDFLHELKQNFGHIGPIFMAYVVTHSTHLERRVRDLMREIDEKAEITAGERFWSAYAATSVCAAEVAYELGLLPYDPVAVKGWHLNVQIPAMRGVVNEEYTGPANILSDYLEQNAGKVLITNNGVPAKPIHGELLAHYELTTGYIAINKSAFKTHCVKIGANSTDVLNTLHTSRIVTTKDYKTTLGKGTEYAKVQSRCFVVNAEHAELSSQIDSMVTADLKTLKPTLRVVK